MAGDVRYRVVLVGVALSPACRLALDHALTVAQAHGARVEAVHAVEKLRPSVPISEVNRAVVRRLQREELDHARAALDRFLPKKPPVPVQAKVIAGDPRDVLVARAKRVKADLIVLASRRRAALGDWILGSTADRVLRAAAIPMLLVPPAPRKGTSKAARGR